MFAMISPALESFSESASTLNFASRAKQIQNTPRVNEDLGDKALLRKYEKELQQLRIELEKRNKNVVDKRMLLELENQRRQAEEDKLAALRALEQRSKELMAAKAEKKILEEKIKRMQSQLLTGGNPDTSVSQIYRSKMEDIDQEQERLGIDGLVQVEKYKKLLLKQRDIMIALTERLNERDESIAALQEEVENYEVRLRETEDELDRKNDVLIKLQRIAMEQNPNIIVDLFKEREFGLDDKSQNSPMSKPHLGTDSNDEYNTLTVGEKSQELQRESLQYNSSSQKATNGTKIEKDSSEYLRKQLELKEQQKLKAESETARVLKELNSLKIAASNREMSLLRKLEATESELNGLKTNNSTLQRDNEQLIRELESQLDRMKNKYMQLYEECKAKLQDRDTIIAQYEEENRALRKHLEYYKR